MQGVILQVGNVIAPVLLCVLVGFAFSKAKLPFDTKMVNSLVSNVGYPTLILAHLADRHVALGAFLDILMGATTAVACFGVIGFLVLKLMRLPARAFLSPMMLNNVGNIGLPVSALAFGDQGLAYALAFLVVVLIGVFTIGMWLPMGKLTFRSLLRSPVIYAVGLTLVLMATDTKLPNVLDKTFEILGGLAIPLMLLTLGYTLGNLKTGALGRGTLLAAIHLAIAAGIALVLTRLFGFDGVGRGVFILQCMMPVSIATYLWVDMYCPEHAPDVASFILVSTLLSVLALPLVLSFWI
ncbi:MAG: AEC family transporter [Pseudomonadota bacterium]